MVEVVERPLRLSTRLTTFLRLVVPSVWLLGFIVGSFTGFASSFSEGLVPLGMAVVGTLWFRATTFQLCDVAVSGNGLHVTRGSKSAFIPFTAIRGARQRHAFGFSEVLLHEPSVFGQVILFVPYLAQLYPYQAEHPADILIQRRVAAVAPGSGA